MTVPTFQSFRSTQPSGWVRGQGAGGYHVLEDGVTGAPVGLQSLRGNGPQGIWAPVDLTASQIASPTADMIADLNATYRLNVAPYTRYQSDGSALQKTTGGGQFLPLAGGTLTGLLTGTALTTTGAHIYTYAPVGTTGGLKATASFFNPVAETIPQEWITNFNITSNNAQDVLGSAFRLYINTGGFNQTSQHTAAIYATNTPFGGSGGTVTFAPAIIGSSGVQSANTVVNAIAFKARALIVNSGGTVTNNIAFYQEKSTNLASNYYGGVFTDPSGVGQFVYGTAMPGAMVDVYGYDDLAGTLLFRVRGNAATNLFTVNAAGGISSIALQSSTTYADDAAAAVGGVAVGQFYRNGSIMQLRIA